MELFSHTLHLDLKFHLMRKTGEITRQLDRGTAAIQNGPPPLLLELYEIKGMDDKLPHTYWTHRL